MASIRKHGDRWFVGIYHKWVRVLSEQAEKRWEGFGIAVFALYFLMKLVRVFSSAASAATNKKPG